MALHEVQVTILAASLAYYATPLRAPHHAAARSGPAAIAAAPEAAVSRGAALVAPGGQLEQQLAAMPKKEQYNTVLASLAQQRGGESAEACLALVEEMSAARIKMSKAALKALLDAALASGSVVRILDSLRAARDNGVCRAFATPSLRLGAKPTERDAAALPPVPVDESGSDAAAAGVFTLACAGLLLVEAADLFDFSNSIQAPPLQLVLPGLLAVWGYDRYTSSGRASDSVGRGLTKLFEKDLQRESAVESASFLVGYLLGLPCCTFAPTAYKPLEMLSQVCRCPHGIAPCAHTHNAHRRACTHTHTWAHRTHARRRRTASRRRSRWPGWRAACRGFRFAWSTDCSSGFLRPRHSRPSGTRSSRRRSRASPPSSCRRPGGDLDQGGWDASEDGARLRWAYAEAGRLLKAYSGLRATLQEQMVAGVSAGDCVVLLEESMKGQVRAV
jgi:hypothetical protein